MDKRFQKNQFYTDLFDNFDKKLLGIINSFGKQYNSKLNKLETKLANLEDVLKYFLHESEAKKEEELKFAEVLVNKEMRSKVLISQWTNHFLAMSDQTSLDPVTFTFARYSLNICICYAEMEAEYFTRANVHRQLVAFANFKSELVVGPALMALAHLSLHHPALRPDIATADAYPMMLKLIVESNSRPILINACKLAASMSLYYPNKSLAVNSGCLHGLLDLILGTNKDFFDEKIQYAALCAVVNTVSGCDANRVLLVELNGLKPLLNAIQITSNNSIILESVKALANVAFGNPFAAGKILSLGGDAILVEVLESGDILRQPLLAHAVLAALSNICNSEATQTRVGGIGGLIEITVRICEHARELFLASEAANLLLALMWRNNGNKSRVSAKNAAVALVKRVIRHCPINDEENNNCVERMAWALSSLLIYQPAQEKMEAAGGLEEFIRICKRHANPRILECLGQVIVAMVPSPDLLKRYHDEVYKPPVERYATLPVLKRVKFQVFKDVDKTPPWMTIAIQCLSLTDEALAREPVWVKEEFVGKYVMFKEFTTTILPDASVLQDVDFRGLIFSVY